MRSVAEVRKWFPNLKSFMAPQLVAFKKLHNRNTFNDIMWAIMKDCKP